MNMDYKATIFIPHEQHERAKVIGVGVHIYVCGPNNFLNRTLAITVSNIRCTTSRRIYKPALPLLSPEMLPRCVNEGFSYLMHTLLYLFEGLT